MHAESNTPDKPCPITAVNAVMTVKMQDQARRIMTPIYSHVACRYITFAGGVHQVHLPGRPRSFARQRVNAISFPIVIFVFAVSSSSYIATAPSQSPLQESSTRPKDLMRRWKANRRSNQPSILANMPSQTDPGHQSPNSPKANPPHQPQPQTAQQTQTQKQDDV